MKKVTIQGKCLNTAASALRSVNVKANEFVKKFGLSHSKLFGNGWITFDDGCIENSVSRTDVKRLVESHELVEIYTRRFNGDAEWFFVSEYCKKNRISPFFSENYNKASGIYKQAIADVESCL